MKLAKSIKKKGFLSKYFFVYFINTYVIYVFENFLLSPLTVTLIS